MGKKERKDEGEQISTPTGWIVCGVSAQRRIVRKALLDAVKAFEEASETHQPIIGYRPRFSQVAGKQR